MPSHSVKRHTRKVGHKRVPVKAHKSHHKSKRSSHKKTKRTHRRKH